MKFDHLFLIGGAGSGKTTLAKRYSDAFEIPHIELDDLYWLEPSTRKKRVDEKRDRLLSDVINQPSWVLEGIFWQPWIEPVLDSADKIVLLDVPEFTRHSRVFKRHLRLLGAARIEDYPTFFPTLFELIKLNRAYDSGALVETKAVLSGYLEKVTVCSSNNEATRLLGLDQ